MLKSATGIVCTYQGPKQNRRTKSIGRHFRLKHDDQTPPIPQLHNLTHASYPLSTPVSMKHPIADATPYSTPFPQQLSLSPPDRLDPGSVWALVSFYSKTKILFGGPVPIRRMKNREGQMRPNTMAKVTAKMRGTGGMG